MINNDSGNNKVMDQKQGDKNFYFGHEADALVHHVTSMKILEDFHIKWLGEVGCKSKNVKMDVKMIQMQKGSALCYAL